MEKLISDLCKNHKLCEIYTNKDELEHFQVGYFISYTEEEVIIHSISEYGRDDGFYWERIEDIFSISYDSEYTKTMELLMKANGTLTDYPLQKGNCEELNLMKTLLDYCQKHHKMISFFTYYGMSRSGYLKNYNASTIEIERYCTDGTIDGNIVVLTNDIKIISFDSLDEMKIEYLVAQRTNV